MVRCLVGILIDRGHLILTRCHLIMTCGYRHPKPIKLNLDLIHAFQDARWDRTEIVIVKLLTLWRFCAE